MEKININKNKELKWAVSFSFIIISLIVVTLLMWNTNGFTTGFVIGDNLEKDYNLYVLDSTEGEDTIFVVPIESREKNVSNAYAQIGIFDSNSTQVAYLETSNISIIANQSVELKAVWNNSANAGEYQLRILIIMDDESYSYTKLFEIDKKTLSLESIVLNDFSLGEKVSFGMVIQNHLNETIKNGSSSILIYDNKNNLLADLRSIQEPIDAETLKIFNLSWDTKEIEAGKYNAQLSIDYDSQVIEKEVVLDVAEKKLEVYGIGYSISGDLSSSNKNMGFILAFLVILLVLVNITWWIRYSRKNNSIKT